MTKTDDTKNGLGEKLSDLKLSSNVRVSKGSDMRLTYGVFCKFVYLYVWSTIWHVHILA
jgi:hypothetical protein